MLFPAPACHCDCRRVRGDSYWVQVKEEGVQVLVSKIHLDSDLHNEHIYLFIVKFFQLCPIN